MNLAVAQKARVFEAGNEAQYARLVAKLEVVLEADQVVTLGAQIFLSQLNHGPGPLASARIAKAHGFHRPEAQRIAATAGEFFNRQAAFKVIELFPLSGFGGLGGQQGVEKAIVLRAVHGTVDVIGGAFVPARGKVDTLHVDALGVDDGRNGVVEGEMAGAGEALDFRSERIGRERAGSDNREVLRTVLVLEE